MTCQKCGAHCQGSYCRSCEVEMGLEDRYGVPRDHFDDAEGVEADGD